jgi:hypothetical protein
MTRIGVDSVKSQMAVDMPITERLLLETVRGLSTQRVVQVLDFARWLHTQSISEEFLDENMTEAELEAEESSWQATFEANKDTFRAMAREALDELDAGETLEMVLVDGKIQPR